jgi:competence ComEA-like helix-hairpin-helix protein
MGQMKWTTFVSDYLSFSRKERIGLLVLTVILLVVFLLPDTINNTRTDKFTSADTSWITALKKLEIKESEHEEKKSYADQSTDKSYAYQYDRSLNHSSNLFYFDPNTISFDEWKKLGLRDKTIHIIQNYTSKGGHFNKPEDLQKIFGLSQKDYERIVPFVKIESRPADKSSFAETKKEYEFKRPTPVVIDINIADTSAFIALPGIGNKLAARIINFREKLGGFYSIEQIGETFGLPDSTFQKIKSYLKLDNVSVKKININTATVDELKTHPYIRYNLAKPIVAYRDEHGPFSKLEDIKNVMAITDEIYLKIVPYLETGR